MTAGSGAELQTLLRTFGEERKVIVASSLGTVSEWYDVYSGDVGDVDRRLRRSAQVLDAADPYDIALE